MNCGHECYKIGGPWIAEDPHCPIHGIDAQAEQRSRDRWKGELQDRIHAAETVDELRAIMIEMLELM